MDDGGPLRPGFASYESPEDEEERADVGPAAYDDVQGSEHETWEQETICLACLRAPTCRHFERMAEHLVCVSRCGHYLPLE